MLRARAWALGLAMRDSARGRMPSTCRCGDSSTRPTLRCHSCCSTCYMNASHMLRTDAGRESRADAWASRCMVRRIISRKIGCHSPLEVCTRPLHPPSVLQTYDLGDGVWICTAKMIISRLAKGPGGGASRGSAERHVFAGKCIKDLTNTGHGGVSDLTQQPVCPWLRRNPRKSKAMQVAASFCNFMPRSRTVYRYRM